METYTYSMYNNYLNLCVLVIRKKKKVVQSSDHEVLHYLRKDTANVGLSY